MPNQPLRRGVRGGFEGGVWGPVPNKPLTTLTYRFFKFSNYFREKLSDTDADP